MDTLYETLERYDLRDLLRMHGVEITDDGFIYAPWRKERTASVCIYADHFYDFGDPEKHGDLVDYLELAEGLTHREACKEAARLLTKQGASEIVPDQVRPKPTTRQEAETHRAPAWLELLVAQAHRALQMNESSAAANARAYLESRGLEACIGTHHLGVVDESVTALLGTRYANRVLGRLIVPTFLNGNPTGFKARDASGKSTEALKTLGIHKYDGPPGCLSVPFNADVLNYAADLGYVVMVEGEVDALSLAAAFGPEYPVLGLPGGNLPAGWDAKLLESGILQAFVLMDNDEAGQRHAKRLEAKLSASGVAVRVLNLTGNNDLNDVLTSLGPEGLVGTVETLMAESRPPSISDTSYLREGFLEELDSRAQRPFATYTTGIPAVDSLLDGGYLEGLHLLGGITGGGKTSLALSIAIHNARAGRPVLLASYEQSRLELWARIAAHITGVPYPAIKRGLQHVDGAQSLVSSVLEKNDAWKEVQRAACFLKIVEAGDALSRTPSVNMFDDLVRTAEAMMRADGAPPLVVIDYLQRMPVPASFNVRDTRERVGAVAAQLQLRLGRTLGCPVLALSSIGRGSYRLAEVNMEERLAAFKEAGELEYTAYTAVMIYDMPPYLVDTLNLSPGRLHSFRPMILDVCKNREGERGRVAVKWEPERGLWHDAGVLGDEREKTPRKRAA